MSSRTPETLDDERMPGGADHAERRAASDRVTAAPPPPDDTPDTLPYAANTVPQYLVAAETDISADPIAHANPTRLRDVHRQVWMLAWPSVLTMLLQTFNTLMDTLFVGHLPNARQALAATGVGGQVYFLVISLAMGVSVGTTALVARFVGADEPDNVVAAAGKSLSLSFGVSLFFAVLFYVSRGTVAGWMLGGGSDDGSRLLAVQFLGAALLSVVPTFVLNVLVSTFRGLGDTRTPLLIQGFIIATHIGCNWVLIYGHLGFPALGVRGAGLALSASIYVGTMCYLIAFVKRGGLARALTPAALHPDAGWYGRILKIGIPASIQAVIRTLGMMTFTGVLARTVEASSAVAAMNIGIRAEAIAFMPGFGYSVAASALVGQALGAKDSDRAERNGWAATSQAVGVMAVMGVVFFVFAHQLAGLFTSDPEVQKLGAEYLRINAFCEPFLALGMVLTGALQGAGDTIRPTYITIFTMWGVRLPLALALMFWLNLQTRGAWWAMMLTTTLGGLLTLLLFRGGKWKQIKV